MDANYINCLGVFYIYTMFRLLAQKWIRFNYSDFWLLQIAYYLVQEINNKKKSYLLS